MISLKNIKTVALVFSNFAWFVRVAQHHNFDATNGTGLEWEFLFVQPMADRGVFRNLYGNRAYNKSTKKKKKKKRKLSSFTYYCVHNFLKRVQ